MLLTDLSHMIYSISRNWYLLWAFDQGLTISFALFYMLVTMCKLHWPIPQHAVQKHQASSAKNWFLYHVIFYNVRSIAEGVLRCKKGSKAFQAEATCFQILGPNSLCCLTWNTTWHLASISNEGDDWTFLNCYLNKSLQDRVFREECHNDPLVEHSNQTTLYVGDAQPNIFL